MSKLIALVAVLTLVDGVRTTLEPGAEVTGLSAHDEAELKRMGAVQDTDELAADKRLATSLESKAAKEFAQAKKLEQAKHI